MSVLGPWRGLRGTWGAVGREGHLESSSGTQATGGASGTRPRGRTGRKPSPRRKTSSVDFVPA